MARRTVFSSESVTRGHPDKICDQISDAIVDAFLYVDQHAEVAAECAVATGLVFLAVNSISTVSVDVTGVARQVIADIGYSVPEDVKAAVDSAEQMVFDVAERRGPDSMHHLHDLLLQGLDRIEELGQRGSEITGIPLCVRKPLASSSERQLLAICENSRTASPSMYGLPASLSSRLVP